MLFLNVRQFPNFIWPNDVRSHPVELKKKKKGPSDPSRISPNVRSSGIFFFFENGPSGGKGEASVEGQRAQKYDLFEEGKFHTWTMSVYEHRSLWSLLNIRSHNDDVQDFDTRCHQDTREGANNHMTDTYTFSEGNLGTQSFLLFRRTLRFLVQDRTTCLSRLWSHQFPDAGSWRKRHESLFEHCPIAFH